MKIVFIYGTAFSSRLTLFFTGSTCYHVGFTDGTKFWDMNKIRRRRIWPGLYPADQVILADAPVQVTAEYLDFLLDTGEDEYGFVDYLLFAMRGIYHLFGQSTRNAGGLICSEMVANDLVVNGWPMKFIEVPSPADLELLIFGRKDQIKAI